MKDVAEIIIGILTMFAAAASHYYWGLNADASVMIGVVGVIREL